METIGAIEGRGLGDGFARHGIAEEAQVFIAAAEPEPGLEGMIIEGSYGQAELQVGAGRQGQARNYGGVQGHSLETKIEAFREEAAREEGEDDKDGYAAFH